ncbi:MAG: ferritin-like domain-containing protein [Candidatus Dormibacteria bacterium]
MTDETTTPVNPTITPTMLEKPHSRRHFIAGAGAAGLGLVAVACGSSSSSSPAAGQATSASPSPSGLADGDIVKLAASLEVLAVGTYKAALDAATSGKLGVVPPAVATFVKTAMAQHQAALDKLNTVAGTPVTDPPADLKAKVDQQFSQVTDVVGAARLALLLEQTAADTYLTATGMLRSPEAVQLAGSIQIIDQQHAAILNYVLGSYPVPDTFQKGDKAYSPAGR